MQRTQARTGSSKENYVTASQGILNLIKSSYKNQKCISIKQFDKKAPSLGLFFNHQNDSLRLFIGGTHGYAIAAVAVAWSAGDELVVEDQRCGSKVSMSFCLVVGRRVSTSFR